MKKTFTILVVVLLLSSPALADQMVLSAVEAPGAPSGYTSFDFFADVDTNLGIMELLVSTSNPGDIYQNASAPDDPDEAFASYVTIGYPASGEQSANTHIWGGAVDLGGGTTWTFDTQNIDIAWSPIGGIDTGAGTFQVARLTLKDGAFFVYQLMGWQTGGYDAVTISDFNYMPGDVNNDGFVGGFDLTQIIYKWGMTGAAWADGDLDGDGTVEGDDYTQVISYWGSSGTPPEPIPEPTTLLLLAGAAVAGLIRRRWIDQELEEGVK